jgi:hypothetical protein
VAARGCACLRFGIQRVARNSARMQLDFSTRTLRTADAMAVELHKYSAVCTCALQALGCRTIVMPDTGKLVCTCC